MSKQDRQGARTVTDLERKYKFGETFAEVMGIATDAREAAENAASGVEGLDEKLDQTEIFNRLTNNGQSQGLFRGDDGELYINAEYVEGTFTSTALLFLEPGKEEVETIQNHLDGVAIIPDDKIPLYDFDNSGVIDYADRVLAEQAARGQETLANWEGAEKSTCRVTIDMSNPEKVIYITGTNMWGRIISDYVGMQFTSMKNPETEARLEELSTDYVTYQILYAAASTNTYFTLRKWSSGTAELWGKTEFTVTTNADGNCYSGVSSTINFPSGFFKDAPLVTFSHIGTSANMRSAINSVSLSGVKLDVTSESQLTNAVVTCWVHAIGVWK